MISLIRPKEPEYLKTREAGWTADLLAAVKKYGSYQSIPKEEKESLTKYYRHEKIKTPLFSAAHDKCAFCECKPGDGGNAIQVEHFYPKSLYPECCFSWENFLPACGRCNTAKGILDTKTTLILNPYFDDPQKYLTLSSLRLRLKPLKDNARARTTINEVNLNSPRLIGLRRDLLGKIEELTEDICDRISDVEDADTEGKKRNRRSKLDNVVTKLEILMEPEQSHSFFSQQVIRDNEDYLRAKTILADF